MKTNPSALSVKQLLETLIKEEVDKTLALSNKRRKEFKKIVKLSEVDKPVVDPNAPLDPAAMQSTPQVGMPQGTTGTDSTTGTTEPAAAPPSQALAGNDQLPPEMGGEQPQQGEKPTEQPKNAEDIVASTKNLANKTSDVPTLMKNIKSAIQTNQNLDPLDVIKGLESTGNIVLNQVASRLKQFMSVKP